MTIFSSFETVTGWRTAGTGFSLQTACITRKGCVADTSHMNINKMAKAVQTTRTSDVSLAGACSNAHNVSPDVRVAANDEGVSRHVDHATYHGPPGVHQILICRRLTVFVRN